MRFSMESTGIVMVWAALAVSGTAYYYSNHFLADKVSRYGLEVASLEIRLKHRREKAQSTQYLLSTDEQRSLELSSLDKLLANEYAAYAKNVSPIAPRRDALSTRRVPVLSSAKGFEYRLRVHVPVEMLAVLKLEATGTDQQAHIVQNPTQEIALESGDNLIRFYNGSLEDKGAANRLFISLNESFVADTSFDAEKLKLGEPFSNTDQKDFSVEDLPVLIVLAPDEVATGLRVSLSSKLNQDAR